MTSLAKVQLKKLIDNYSLSRGELLALIKQIKPPRGYGSGKLAPARIFLTELLRDGPRPLTEINKLGKKEKLSPQTLRRTFISMGGTSAITGHGKNRKAFWRLPGPGSEEKVEKYFLKHLPGDRERIVQKLVKQGFNEKLIDGVAHRMGLTLKEGWRWELPVFTKTLDGKLRVNQ